MGRGMWRRGGGEGYLVEVDVDVKATSGAIVYWVCEAGVGMTENVGLRIEVAFAIVDFLTLEELGLEVGLLRVCGW